jgi:hypothetical protein
MDRPTSGRPRAGVGSAGRVTKLTHPDRAVVEPSGSRLERTRAARLDTGSTRIHGLGRTAARVRRATADSRTRVERTRGRGVGRPEDRGARGSRGALVVGAGPTAFRAGGRCSAVELALPGGSPGTCSVVTPGTGASRARAQLDRCRAFRRRRVRG